MNTQGTDRPQQISHPQFDLTTHQGLVRWTGR